MSIIINSYLNFQDHFLIQYHRQQLAHLQLVI